MPLLWLAQKQNNNFLTLAAMKKIAKMLEIPDMAVYEVASFYTMYNRTSVGKYHLQICGTTPCMVRGARDIINTALTYLNAEKDHVTEDGLFCVSEVECLGACVNAPMMQVNNEWFYEDLTPKNLVNVIEKFRNNEYISPGPQIPERKNSEGPLGRTSLKQFEPLIINRDFAQAKVEWEEAKVKLAATQQKK